MRTCERCAAAVLPPLTTCYACGKPLDSAAELTVVRAWECPDCGVENPIWRRDCHSCSCPSPRYQEAAAPRAPVAVLSRDRDAEPAVWNQGDPAAWQAATLRLREPELALPWPPSPSEAETSPPTSLRLQLTRMMEGVAVRWRRPS